jgi:pyruvate dehydrogenase E2 component (dihydrolipoamide acetyltransferase)
MGVKHNLLMPKLGLTVTEGALTEWSVEPGQRVRQGEVFFVIETEKVANEIEASADGCIGEIRVLAGATVPVGEVLATLTNAGWLASAATDPARPTVSNVSALTIRGDTRSDRVSSQHRWPQAGIDLHTLRRSGPNGRIRAHDVQAAAGGRTAAWQIEGRAQPGRRQSRAAVGAHSAHSRK